MFAPYRPVAFTGLTDPSSSTPTPAREQPPRVAAPPTSEAPATRLSYGMRIPGPLEPARLQPEPRSSTH